MRDIDTPDDPARRRAVVAPTDGPVGALCIHGFTGNPGSMRPVAEAFAAAGFAVELPRLPGHGTTVEDMMTTGWEDWSAEAEAAYQRLAARCEQGRRRRALDGRPLTLWLAHAPSGDRRASCCINAAVAAAADRGGRHGAGHGDEGTTVMPGIGSDIADPDVEGGGLRVDAAVPLLSLDGRRSTTAGRARPASRCPVLIMTQPPGPRRRPGDSPTTSPPP